MGALSGLKVLDCTHVIAGAYCSLILADLGADVVKIEPPTGESTRGFGADRGAFRAYDFVNRNKRAIALDLSTAAGVEILRKLAESADVFVENYRPGSLDRMGLGYEALSKINPRLVYGSISGFGLDGPYRSRGGFDLIAQAMSGLMSFVGDVGSERPCSTAVPISDLNAGAFGAIAILAALQSRNTTGQGQHVESSLLESALASTIWESGMYLTTGAVPTRNGTRHRLAAPYEALRMKNRDALQARLEAILATDTSDSWVLRLEAVGVPAGRLNSIAEAWDDPQIQARGMLAQVGDRRFPRTPIKMSETPVAITRGPAEIGEHTREVLGEGGWSETEIEALVASGAAAVERKQEVRS